jgi:menaquinone-dependent protoporphyrinogen oxidase
MAKILVAYASMAGSTEETARVVGEEIARSGCQVEVTPLSAVKRLDGYDGVVLGAPMIMGWYVDARRFLWRHRQALRHLPFAIFVMAMSLTQTGDREVEGVPVCVDDHLPKLPATAGQLNFRERYAQLRNYLRPILAAARPARPASIGVFGGRLEYGRLKWWAVLFVMLVIQAPAGDRRNWAAIRAWAAGLPAAFQLASTPAGMTELG